MSRIDLCSLPKRSSSWLIIMFWGFVVVIVVVEDRVSLHSLVCPGTHFVDQADLELTESRVPVSASRLLEL